ncbi:hypothetical protein [Empedobacter brevis]|uniref:hypothetical protein n=1 Tax=Empedobacter brevis TaxID=247 RepID=UPI002FE3FDB8
MNDWISFPKRELMMEIYLGEQNMEEELLLFWNKIKLSPEFWKCSDIIEENFWVIAQYQHYIIWYNDIEEGFNLSRFKTNGQILEYAASNNELSFTIKELKNRIVSI